MRSVRAGTATRSRHGFITNHSYLDNPTIRGMRQSLMQSFEQIYLLNLHGNSLKKERCPDGSKDENVFDIPHYCHVVTALANTIRIQCEIDALYSEVEKNLIVIERDLNT